MKLFTITETDIPGVYEVQYHVSPSIQVRELAIKQLLETIEQKAYNGLIVIFGPFVPQMSITQIFEFVEKELAVNRLRIKPSAYVIDNSNNAISFMQDALINRGKNTAVFDKREEAFRWLRKIIALNK